jgi:hypothetical protein
MTRAIFAFVATTALLTACAKGGSTATSNASPSSSAGVPGAGSAAIASLPAGCDGASPAPTSTSVSFAAGGRVWAFSPDDPTNLHCLFTQADAGAFSWGPRGDRVILAGLQVKGVGSSAARPPGNFHPTYFTWSRPSGTTIWFTAGSDTSVFRADIGGASATEITPLPNVTYGDMAYHPSGLAVGFVSTDARGTGLWMSTNTGANPQQLVAAPPGTTFGHIVFAHDGKGLYYSVDKADGTHSLARVDLPTDTPTQNLWTGGAPIGGDIIELAGVPGLGLTVGATCAQHKAVFSALDGTAGAPLASGLSGPTSVVGRLDADRFIVAAAGCGGRQDLYLAHVSGQAPQLLVKAVDNAGMRLPEPVPAPALPQNLPRSGFA